MGGAAERVRSAKKSRDAAAAVVLPGVLELSVATEPIGTDLHLHGNEAFLRLLGVVRLQLKFEIRVDESRKDGRGSNGQFDGQR